MSSEASGAVVAGVEGESKGVRAWIEANPRRFWLSLILGVIAPLYFPLNVYTPKSRAISLATWIDDGTPFLPAATWVYTLVYLSALYPLFVVKSRRLFHAVGATFASVMLISFVVFLIQPVSTQVLGQPPFRPLIADLPDGDFTSWTLCLNFHLDPPNNCFPSLHIGLAFAVVSSCWRASRKAGLVTLFAALAISVSTMLVKQHYIADVVGGLIVAGIVDRLVMSRYDAMNEPFEERGQEAWVAWMFVPLYLCALSVTYGLYCTGYRPWR